MLTDFQTKKLTYLFNLFDLNHNEKLQLDDFTGLAETIRAKLDFVEDGKEHESIKNKAIRFFKALLRDIPRPDQFGIVLRDWLDFFDEEIVNNEDDIVVDEYVRILLAFLFGMFDDNHDGYISSEEYQDLFSIYGLERHYSKKAFDRVDVNKDGRLSRYELIPAVETFLTSDDPKDAQNWIFGNWEQTVR